MTQVKLTQQQITSVSLSHVPNERIAFKRRQDALKEFVRSKINPLEDAILTIRAQLYPLYDEVGVLRADMIAHCIHNPSELSGVLSEDKQIIAVTCKTCLSVFHVDAE